MDLCINCGCALAELNGLCSTCFEGVELAAGERQAIARRVVDEAADLGEVALDEAVEFLSDYEEDCTV